MSKVQIVNLFIGLVLATTLLVGCSTEPTIPSKEPIPDSLLVECLAPIHLTGTTGKDVADNYVANAAIWKSCRDSHTNLIKAVKATQ